MIGNPLHCQGAVFALTGLLCALGCDEATVSLFPLQENSPPASAGAPPLALPDPEPSEAGLVSHWPFDGDATDLLGGNAATVEGTASFVPDPVRGNVLLCDGTSAILSFQNQTPLDFSYAFWLWTESPSLTGASARGGSPLVWSNVDGAEDDFMLALVNDRLAYMSYSNPATGTLGLIDKLWHHVVVTRKDTERVALYVDGKLDGDGDSGTGGVLVNPLVHVCGSPVDRRYFAGRLDDLRLYAKVLTADEVQALYLRTGG